jgi:hypothetical protein
MLLESLAIDAALGHRIGLEPIAADGFAAALADAVAADIDAMQGSLNVAQLPYVMIDIGQVEVHQQIRQRILFNIMYLSGDFYVALVIAAEQRLVDRGTQSEATLLK